MRVLVLNWGKIMAVNAFVVIPAANIAQTVTLHTYTWQVKKGQQQGTILVNGKSKQPTKLTKGRGQGTTVEYCCYFTHAVEATQTAPASAVEYFFWSTGMFATTFLPQSGVEIYIGVEAIAAAVAKVEAQKALELANNPPKPANLTVEAPAVETPATPATRASVKRRGSKSHA